MSTGQKGRVGEVDALRPGGFIDGGVSVVLHEAECVLQPDGDGGWVCRRATHAKRHQDEEPRC